MAMSWYGVTVNHGRTVLHTDAEVVVDTDRVLWVQEPDGVTTRYFMAECLSVDHFLVRTWSGESLHLTIGKAGCGCG